MTAPTYVINGQEFIDNTDCPRCGLTLGEGSPSLGSWVRDYIRRDRWHPDCWVAAQKEGAGIRQVLDELAAIDAAAHAYVVALDAKAIFNAAYLAAEAQHITESENGGWDQ